MAADHVWSLPGATWPLSSNEFKLLWKPLSLKFNGCASVIILRVLLRSNCPFLKNFFINLPIYTYPKQFSKGFIRYLCLFTNTTLTVRFLSTNGIIYAIELLNPRAAFETFFFFLHQYGTNLRSIRSLPTQHGLQILR